MTDANTPEKDADAAAPVDPELEERLRSELAPEEAMFKDWLPRPSPIDGPAPAP
ncbi:hypothetical protein SAMN05428970_1682 [Agromyces sp. CF514]|uniref:hypothetical protein n=1 Tax=Agromyces sp. CF514 TaxID=1881031 RepID=UPI0008F2FE37|nr:hypothetical protein [Agromyces sp. CF514]SFR74232.1 hypothetical protein SAMN05428970_1682 [Agromyces sp. CF514]